MPREIAEVRRHGADDETEDTIDGYVVPNLIYIGRGPGSERLYRHEERAAEAIQAGAKELAVILKHDAKDYWRRTMGFQLLQTLEGFDTKASTVAAVAYLRAKRPDLLK